MNLTKEEIKFIIDTLQMEIEATAAGTVEYTPSEKSVEMSAEIVRKLEEEN